MAASGKVDVSKIGLPSQLGFAKEVDRGERQQGQGFSMGLEVTARTCRSIRRRPVLALYRNLTCLVVYGFGGVV